MLVLHHVAFLGGAELNLLETLEHLRLRGWQLHLVLAERGPLADRAERLGIEVAVHPFPVFLETPSLARAVAFTARVAEAVRRLRAHVAGVAPDLVYANSVVAAIFASLVLALDRRPLVVDAHDLVTPSGSLVGPAMRLWGRRATRILAVSEAVRGNLVAWGIAADKIAVSYLGVRPPSLPNRLEREHRRRELGIDAGICAAAVVGSIEPRKGLRTLLRALAAAEHRNLSLFVIGATPPWARRYEREVRELASRLADPARVRFLGFRDDVRRLLAAFDLLVSAAHDEPFGTTILEGMAAGLPTVVTDSGGSPEACVHESTGLVAADRSAESLALALDRLASDAELRRRMGESGRHRVMERFRFAHWAETFEAELLGLLRTPPNAPHAGVFE